MLLSAVTHDQIGRWLHSEELASGMLHRRRHPIHRSTVWFDIGPLISDGVAAGVDELRRSEESPE